MNRAIPVINPSIYWADFEAEKAVYYYMEWTNDLQQLRDREIDFVNRYIAIALRYRIAEPLFNGKPDELRIHYEAYANARTEKGSAYMSMLDYLYRHDNRMVYPSLLFTGDKFQQVIGVDPLLTIENIDDEDKYGSYPIKVQMSVRGTRNSLYCCIDNDIFCSEVDNKKVKRDPEIGEKRCWVDNRATTKLNVPRLNSFLRDLKALCAEFGANDFSFENTLDADPANPDYFTENGVMIDGKYYYYEDIKEELKENGFEAAE